MSDENGLLWSPKRERLRSKPSRYRDFVLELRLRRGRRRSTTPESTFGASFPRKAAVASQSQINLKQWDELNLIKFPEGRSTGLDQAGEWNHVKLHGHRDTTMEINGQNPLGKRMSLARQARLHRPARSKLPAAANSKYQGHHMHQALPTAVRRPVPRRLGRRGRAGREVLESDGRPGQMVCTGERTPRLRSKEQHGNYNLPPRIQAQGRRQQRRLRPRAQNSDHHGDGAGVEIQVCIKTTSRAYHKPQALSIHGQPLRQIVPASQRVSQKAAGGTRSKSIAAVHALTASSTTARSQSSPTLFERPAGSRAA